MRKQTKLVAVLSAAALLAVGASMTSFAAGWTEENGTWVYYDGDDELVTNEWKKSGSNYYYLNDDGEMATETWVDDEYYVDETGKMVTNQWEKLMIEDWDWDDPDEDGEAWFWFDSKGKKVTDTKKTINGKVYYFDEDGAMRTGWYTDENNATYYLGEEDDGARKSGWLWLEKPDMDYDDVDLCDDEDCTNCEEEGWYWFAKDGRVYTGAKQKKIEGKYYYFNEHGQMLYNWVVASGSNYKDNEDQDGVTSDIDDMRYMANVDKGWRVNGWLELDGSYNMGKENDTDWYFLDKSKAKYADKATSDVQPAIDTVDPRYREKIKAEGKYFCVDENGAMKTGLQAMVNDFNNDGVTSGDFDTYYFDENGFMKTGKVSDVELDNGDVANFYFATSNAKRGVGVTGEENGYLYYKGMRLEAEDDYAFYEIGGDLYLVNDNGKIQKPSKSGKKVDAEKIENGEYALATILDGMGNQELEDINVYLEGSSNSGKISKVWANTMKDKDRVEVTSRISVAEETLYTEADVDFGWED